jgi:multidrug efflux system membrane fusion protein
MHEEQVPAPTQRKRPSRRSMWIGSAIALLAVVGMAWLAWSLTHPDTAETSASGGPPNGGRPAGGRAGGGRGGATTVGIAAAEAAVIPVVLDALGTVVPQATVRVRPQVSGVLQTIRFKEGQMVKKGELLATIDPRPFEAALQQAMGARQRNEAQLAAAQVTLQRYQTLLKQDSIARQDVDTQAAQVRQLQGTMTSDRAAEQSARLNLAYTRIVAPISGRVGLRPVDVGNVVGPGDANGIALITQLTPIDVEFAVPQDHASWLQHNSGAFMEVKAFDRTRTTLLDTGVFASLDNQVDPQTGTVRAKARFNNARMQLFPSQFVNVQVQLRTIRDAVVVPVAAVRTGGQGDYVFVVQDDRSVKLRPVVRGQAMADKVQIASGLSIGEKVVTEGADRLRDGSRVMLPGDAPGAGREGGGRRQRGAQPPASAAPAPSAPVAPFTGASAARAPLPASPQRGAEQKAEAPALGQAPTPFAPASAMMGARGRELTPEQREERRKRLEAMSPEERQAMRERFRQRREAGAGADGSQ